MAERRYTKNGEWITYDGALWKVGLAASSAADLGDVTFVELPSLGRSVVAGEAVCVLEAVKAAADFYCPVDGRIAAVNNRLGPEPQLVTASPEDEGWIFALDSVPPACLEDLLDEAQWKAWEAGA
jgi:glycine cleavage system H protein